MKIANFEEERGISEKRAWVRKLWRFTGSSLVTNANNNTGGKTNIDLGFANRVLKVYMTINDLDSSK